MGCCGRRWSRACPCASSRRSGGAWDEARDVRERVASRRGTVEVVVDAKRAEDAARAEAELLSLLDDEEAKATRASKKNRSARRRRPRRRRRLSRAPAVVADDEPDSESDGEANLLRLARHAPEQAPAEAPAPAPAARRRRKGKKAAPVVVELPPAPARPAPAVVKAPAAVPASGQGAASRPRKSRRPLSKGRREGRRAAPPVAPAAPSLSLGGLAAPCEAPARSPAVAAIGPSPHAIGPAAPTAAAPTRAAEASPFGFSMGGDPAPAQLGAEASPFGSSFFSLPAAPAPSRQPSRQPRADECPVCFGTTRECALVPCGHLLCDTRGCVRRRRAALSRLSNAGGEGREGALLKNGARRMLFGNAHVCVWTLVRTAFGTLECGFVD